MKKGRQTRLVSLRLIVAVFLLITVTLLLHTKLGRSKDTLRQGITSEDQDDVIAIPYLARTSRKEVLTEQQRLAEQAPQPMQLVPVGYQQGQPGVKTNKNSEEDTIPSTCVTVKYFFGSELTDFENDWLTFDLLALLGCPIRVIQDNNHYKSAPPEMENGGRLILFYNCYWQKSTDTIIQYIQQAKKNGYKSIGLFHLGDELPSFNNYDLYPHVDWIFKNHWYPFYFDSTEPWRARLTYMPLGYKNGFGPIPDHLLVRSSDRYWAGFFAGQSRSSANAMQTTALTLQSLTGKPFNVTISQGWNKGAFPKIAFYRNMMLSSVFVLCPEGVAPETFRLSEALEAGAIPLMEDRERKGPPSLQPWRSAPFPIFSDWKHVPAIVEPLFKDPIKLNQMQMASILWWKKWKKELKDKFVENVFKDWER